MVDSYRTATAASGGDMLMTRAWKRGAAAVVTDGGLRDGHVLSRLPFPTYASQVTITTRAAQHHVADLNVPIGCAGVAVYPGDVLIGDRDGVLVIPRALAAEIAEQGYEQEKLEAYVSTKIHAGEPLWGNYPPGDELKADTGPPSPVRTTDPAYRARRVRPSSSARPLRTRGPRPRSGRHERRDSGVKAMEESLLATCWSSAGDAASDRDDLRSPLPLRERIEAASAAGFRGFGLLSADLPAAEQEYGLNGIRAMLDDNGIVDLELEGIPYWWDDGPRREESDRIRHALLNAAEALGARHIKVTPDGDDAPWDPDHWAGKFAELAAQADGVGTRLGLEFFPWSNIKTLHDGLQLVEAAGHDAAGVVIDVWHIERANTPLFGSRLRSAAQDHRSGTQRRRSERRRDAVRGHGASTPVLR